MFDSDPPELRAFRELELLVRHLADELATFRRRALSAEGRLRELEGGHASGPVSALQERVAELERENGELRARLDTAGQRVRQMFDRVHFLRQQVHQSGGADR